MGDILADFKTRCTDRVGHLLRITREYAVEQKAELIGSEHLLLAILKENQSIAAKVLRAQGITSAKLLREIKRLVTPPLTPISAPPPCSPRLARIFGLAVGHAQRLNCSSVATEHLMFAIIEESGSVAAQVLVNMGVKLDVLREALHDELGVPLVPEKDARSFESKIKDLYAAGMNITLHHGRNCVEVFLSAADGPCSAAQGNTLSETLDRAIGLLEKARGSSK